ncbi:ADP-ribose pyrophosphatase YjhB, NUDIX family [Micromonospora rhizosphaerae]|uniref:ADP-ribose pyrophosphatase YjhB, NUDIX family n=1 Tax=Micromonospora rhizosphaerae TaxID=568872 RepID=A0A1C6TET2_9ACTN|nr:ADP-ribose pyrophosphatase YjhB, NUDIX family [Micromonospora rhizosphaerae]
MEQRRRIGAYGVLGDADGRVLLARGSAGCPYPGVWQLPGGGLKHAEHPAAAVVREFAEETGLAVRVTGVRDAVADVATFRDAGVIVHTDRLVFDVEARGGELRPEPAGGSDELRWFTPDEAAGVPLMPFTAELLGLPVAPPAAGPAPGPAARARRSARHRPAPALRRVRAGHRPGRPGAADHDR